MTQETTAAMAGAPYVVIGATGDHYIAGTRCGRCQVTFLGERLACAVCGSGDAIQPCRLGQSGRIRACSVVSRSYPGVPVPFVAAVVELDGGGILRGTVSDAPTSLPGPAIGTRVRIAIEDTGQRDPTGRPYFCQVFHLDGTAGS